MRDEDYERLQELELFIDRYASVIDTALRTYAEDMTASAVPLEAQYRNVSADPERRAAQDKSWVTTNGLKHMAVLLRESANQAVKARSALAELEEDDDE